MIAALRHRVHVTEDPAMSAVAPRLRPARVTVTTRRGKFTRQVDEALGSRLVPLDDRGLLEKFNDLVAPVLGAVPASQLSDALWGIEKLDDVRPLIESSTRPPH